MKTRQRLHDFYEQAHPLALPKAIHQELRDSARTVKDGRAQVRHLWICLSKEGLHSSSAPSHNMDADMWLNLVDESAGVGVSSIIISVGADLTERPEVWKVCQWGQQTHNMLIGLHITADLSVEALAPVRELDPAKTFLFVHSSRIERYRPLAQDLGVRIFESDGLRDGVEQRHCTLPSQMACVGSEGRMYTCGLVLHNDHYDLGDARCDRVDNAMTDDALPHAVPAGTSNEPHRCDGCPPLMEDRMRKETGRE